MSYEGPGSLGPMPKDLGGPGKPTVPFKESARPPTTQAVGPNDRDILALRQLVLDNVTFLHGVQARAFLAVNFEVSTKASSSTGIEGSKNGRAPTPSAWKIDEKKNGFVAYLYVTDIPVLNKNNQIISRTHEMTTPPPGQTIIQALMMLLGQLAGRVKEKAAAYDAEAESKPQWPSR